MKAKVIKSANSPCGFPLVSVRKKHGSPRLWVDYGALNKKRKADKYPIMNIGKVLNGLEEVTVFSEMHMFAGCWQVSLPEPVQEKKTFRCRYGTH